MFLQGPLNRRLLLELRHRSESPSLHRSQILRDLEAMQAHRAPLFFRRALTALRTLKWRKSTTSVYSLNDLLSFRAQRSNSRLVDSAILTWTVIFPVGRRPIFFGWLAMDALSKKTVSRKAFPSLKIVEENG